MRLLVSGYREYKDEKTIQNEILKVLNCSLKQGEKFNLKNHTLIHGGCGGTDITAGKIGFLLGLNVEIFPANWKKYGLKAGPIRNLEMIEKGRPDFALLFMSKKKQRNAKYEKSFRKKTDPFFRSIDRLD